jgi:hypothetical protein
MHKLTDLSPTLPPDPREKVYQLAELRQLTDEQLASFFDACIKGIKSPDRGVWARSTINKGNCELILFERMQVENEQEQFELKLREIES